VRQLGAALVGAALLVVVGGALPTAMSPIMGPSIVRAASPQPSGGAGDTRSAGEAPGFVGSPLAAVAAVLGLGLLAALATIGYVRLTGGPGRAGRPNDDDSPAAQP
jgi:hypothetical protein